MKEEELGSEIVNIGGQATEIMREYFEGTEKDNVKADKALRMLTHSTKIMHMNLVRKNSERGHALQLLKYLPDDDVRSQYIRLTNPTAGRLLEARPANKKSKSKT
jgi:hypothetical protein